MEDLNPNGNFMSKPTRGWLHSDQEVADIGISYSVRYIGCLEVNTSMKSLDFDTRSLIAKECINKLCEIAGLKTVDRRRKVDKRLQKMLADQPNMDHAGANVSLTITSSFLNLVSMETGEVIAYHEMPKISFASGGDNDTLDFVSYVAKDHRYGRACFVLECGGGLAQDVITTIGQAFELRYKQFLKKVPGAKNGSELHEMTCENGNLVVSRDDPEYYNDLPGKMPPDIIASASYLDDTSVKSTSQRKMNSNAKPYPVPYATTSLQNNQNRSLIDLGNSSSELSACQQPKPEYVNTTVWMSSEQPDENSLKHDIFDMQPFVTSLSSVEFGSSSPDCMLNVLHACQQNTGYKTEFEKSALLEEPWFHGCISRQESEALVLKDGDFLVRESQNTPGQYVLTGMQRSSRKHLLLVDPEGKVRTKDQVFESVSHLIRYHRDNCLPIISSESALFLKTPVLSTSKSVQV